MTHVDWFAATLGGGVGLVVGALYFLGLAVGMRYALRCQAPIKVLSLSAAVRMAVLLGAGWVVVAQAGPWAALGYALAFLIVRFAATTYARLGGTIEAAP